MPELFTVFLVYSQKKEVRLLAALIEIKGLTKKYRLGQEVITALDNVNLEIEEGEFLCILGTSGSGKSTLLHIMAGLERATKGEVLLRGVSLTKMKEKNMAGFRRKYMGFIFQSYNLIPSLTALENVALPLIFDRVDKKLRQKRARELLLQVGLGNRLKNKPTEMSGGQQQRVSIARALVNNPKIIFADEPTGNLDSKTTIEIMEILKEKAKSAGVTIIMVTHDLEIAQYGDRVISMRDGKIIKIVNNTNAQGITKDEII
jgi:putative ABC transport system ATP-binding protein